MDDLMSDLSDWDEDIMDEIGKNSSTQDKFELEGSVNITFVSSEFVAEVKNNVQDVILNVMSVEKPDAAKDPAKTKSKKKKKNLPIVKLSRSWNEIDVSETFNKALELVLSDKTYLIGIFKQVRKSQLLSLKELSKEEMEFVNNSICQCLFQIIENCDNVFVSKCKSVIWKNYYALLSDKTSLINRSWEPLFLRLVYVERSDLLKQKLSFSILSILVEKLLTSNEHDASIQIPTYDLSSTNSLSSREENIIRYVAGYIPFVLIKHYKKTKHVSASGKFISLLESFSDIGKPNQNF